MAECSFYRVEDVAVILDVSTKWVYQQLAKGNLPGAFRIERTWFFDREVFLESLKQRAVARSNVQTQGLGGSKNRHNL